MLRGAAPAALRLTKPDTMMLEMIRKEKFKEIMKGSPVLQAIARSLMHRGRKLHGMLSRGRMIEHYLRSHQVRKLQLGAGDSEPPGWICTALLHVPGRIAYLDVTRPFPFPDESIDYIYSEHLIEHIPYESGLRMLRECHRVLRPGGRIRIATPDLETLVTLYEPAGDEQQEYIAWVTDRFIPYAGSYSPCFVINNAFRNCGHQFLYDARTLEHLLLKVGFKGITFHAPGESSDEHLRGMELHGRAIGSESVNQFETMVAEGIRCPRLEFMW